MKKGLLLLVATGAFLVSCGHPTEEQAAKDFCDCHGESVKLSKEAGQASNTDELFGGSSEMASAMVKQKQCHDAWMKTYNGRVDIEVLKEEVKSINEDVYNMAEEQGFFGE